MSHKGLKSISKSRSVLKFWILIVPVLAIAAALYLTSKQEESVGIGGPFSMQMADGSTISEDFLTHQSATFIYFGYTACPDICPTSLATLAAALDAIPKEKQNETRTLFVSVDPDRDKGADLDDYAKLFHPTFLGVTGSRAQIDAMVAAYNAYYKIEKSDDEEIYPVDHSAILYLMGRDGKYISHFSSHAPPEKITRKLLEIL